MSAERLDGKEQNQDGAGDAHDGGAGKIWVHHRDALDGSEHALGRRQNTIGHHQRNAEHASDFEGKLGRPRLLEEIPDAASCWAKLAGVMTLQLQEVVAVGVVACNAGVARQERVEGKCAALAIVVGTENDEGVFDGDDQGQGPDDDGERANEIVPAGLGCES